MDLLAEVAGMGHLEAGHALQRRDPGPHVVLGQEDQMAAGQAGCGRLEMRQGFGTAAAAGS